MGQEANLISALLVDESAPSGLRVGSVPEPTPGPDQVVIDVAAVSIVDRDLRYAPRFLGAGGVWGFDAAGVVMRAAADGSGPELGTTVVTFVPAPGAWAHQVATAASDVAVLPAGVDPGTATALAMPGVSARQAIGECGPLAGRRVLVTGASTGVGWYAVQLAALAGAHVVASVRDPADADAVAEIGAKEVVTDVASLGGLVDRVIDIVGGATLSRAVDLLDDDGVAVAVGAISGEPIVLTPDALASPRRRRLQGYWGRWPVGEDLTALVDLLATGQLRPTDGWRGSWTKVAELAAGFADGRLRRRRAILDLR